MGRKATLKKQRKVNPQQAKALSRQGQPQRPRISDLIGQTGEAPNQVIASEALAMWSNGKGIEPEARHRLHRAVAALRSVAGDRMAGAFLRMNAALYMASRSDVRDPFFLSLDLEEIRRDLLEITAHPSLQAALVQYGLAVTDETADPFRLVFTSIFALQKRAVPWVATPFALRAEGQITRLGHLDCHLDAAADIAAGRCLHDAGQLVLHRRRRALGDTDFQELCLSFRSADGCLSFFPRRGEQLNPSSVRSMRAFVTGYKGETLGGTVSPHPMAPRVCRLIGLRVDAGRGVLEGVLP